MTESELKAAVLDLCDELQLLGFHARDSRFSTGPGFPDLVIAGPGGVIFRELKSDDGETSPEQDLWGWMLCTGGASWQVWRPDDWRHGIIRQVLEQLSQERKPTRRP